jgi:hypothetical protein
MSFSLNPYFPFLHLHHILIPHHFRIPPPLTLHPYLSTYILNPLLCFPVLHLPAHPIPRHVLPLARLLLRLPSQSPHLQPVLSKVNYPIYLLYRTPPPLCTFLPFVVTVILSPLFTCRIFISPRLSLQGLTRHPPRTWFTLQVLLIPSLPIYLTLTFLPITRLILLNSLSSKNPPVFHRLFNILSGVRPCTMR